MRRSILTALAGALLLSAAFFGTRGYAAIIGSDGGGTSGGGVSSWNQLQDIPAGFSDGTDDGGASADFNLFKDTGQAIIRDSELFLSTAEAKINSGAGFLNFSSTGQAAINTGVGFRNFASTGQAQLEAWSLYKTTGEGQTKSYGLFRSSAEAEINQWNLFVATAESTIDGLGAGSGEGFALYKGTAQAQLEAWNLYRTTGQGLTKSYSLFRSSAEGEFNQWNLYIATAEALVDGASGKGDAFGNHIPSQPIVGANIPVTFGSATFNGPVTIIGPTGVSLNRTTETIMQDQTGATPATRFEVTNTSVTVFGTFYSTGNSIIVSTLPYTGWLKQVFVSSMVISTPATNGYGNPYWGQLDSSGVVVVYEFRLDDKVTATDPQISLIWESTGTYPDNIVAGIAIGTATPNGTGRDDIIWKSTMMVHASTPTAGFTSKVKESGSVAFTGAGTQANNTKTVFVKVWATTGTSGQRFLHPPTLHWRKEQR